MQSIFIHELDDCVVVYFHDVLVYSTARVAHSGHPTHILKKVREQQLSLQLLKCEIVTQRDNYSAFVVEPGSYYGESQGNQGVAGGARQAPTGAKLLSVDRILQEVDTNLQELDLPAVSAVKGLSYAVAEQAHP